MSYVKLAQPRIYLEPTEGDKALVVPANRNIFIILFLSVWLCGWTVGGGAAVLALFTDFHMFLVIWLCAWAIGWGGAAFVLSWMLTGWQKLRVVNGDLEIETAILWLRHRALYHGQEIQGLKAVPDLMGWQRGQFPPLPFLSRSRGTVKFNYGARTHSTGYGLDEPEAQLIVNWLGERLPGARA
jgi:hypothetical protein